MLLSQSFYAATNPSVEAALNQLSYKERSALADLFCSFIKYGHFGHVVFYTMKPASLTAIDRECSRRFNDQRSLIKGWKCWRKYEHLFQHSNFIFAEEEVVFGDEKLLHIFIINKKTLLSSLYDNIEHFKAILGADFSPENFIVSIEKEKVLRPLIHHDDALLGMILGFGVEAPSAFKEQHEKYDDDLIPEWTPTYSGINIPCPKKCIIFPVAFVGNPDSEEVNTLIDTYAQELENIWEMYRGSKNPLKMILYKLCENE